MPPEKGFNKADASASATPLSPVRDAVVSADGSDRDAASPVDNHAPGHVAQTGAPDVHPELVDDVHPEFVDVYPASSPVSPVLPVETIGPVEPVAATPATYRNPFFAFLSFPVGNRAPAPDIHPAAFRFEISFSIETFSCVETSFSVEPVAVDATPATHRNSSFAFLSSSLVGNRTPVSDVHWASFRFEAAVDQPDQPMADEPAQLDVDGFELRAIPNNSQGPGFAAAADLPIIDLVGVNDDDDIEAAINASLPGTSGRPVASSSTLCNGSGVSPRRFMSSIPRLVLVGSRGRALAVRSPPRDRSIGFGGMSLELPNILVSGGGSSGDAVAAPAFGGFHDGCLFKFSLAADKNFELNPAFAAASKATRPGPGFRK